MDAVTYRRPDHLDPRTTDPAAPAADLDPTGATCGAETAEMGEEWFCTRRPHHLDNEHRAAFDRGGDGPADAVGYAWRDELYDPSPAPVAPRSGLRDTGTQPPFTLAHTITWTELRADVARASAAHWVEGSRKHRQHAREPDRFDAIAAELHRLRDLDTAAE